MFSISTRIPVSALLLSAATLSPAQSPVLKVDAKLASAATVGANSLIVTVSRPDGSLISDATLTISVAMAEMDMGTAYPKAVSQGGGTYKAELDFTMAGSWKVTVRVDESGQPPVIRTLTFRTSASGSQMSGMAMGAMQGRLGPWGMAKEGSGTSWLPESSPMNMKALPKFQGFDLSLMGFINFDENNSGGKRGDNRFFSNSMIMLMGSKPSGSGVLGVSLMGSFDVLFNGEFGYPDLFQTGETAHGVQLTDYQHPHDLIDEVTVSYSRPIGHGLGAFVYGGPVGEPALGGPTFMHRPSGVEIPEAPISHHWFDSTHISWGVLTAGVNSDQWQIEGSLFNGHEPNENRYAPDPVSLNSASGRITFDPTRDLSLNASYGYLNSPESTAPGVDQHRLTAALLWNRPLPRGDNLAFTAGFGRNVIEGKNSDAVFAEATWMTGPTSIFGRWEHVEKDDLVGIPAGNYMINKFLVGAMRSFAHRSGLDYGIGGYAGFYAFPSSLDPYYGRSPVTLGVFVRIRPGS
ncbi:MAG TPA: FixH family protein [Fimbriimonadaceae bacterium]|nr:FixH family protein [Fimbriimonadaceae bacterium]